MVDQRRPDWAAINSFWFDSGPERWFSASPQFDAECREHFLEAYYAAATRQLESWREGAESVLALILLLDQAPRNLYRAQPRSWATDAQALETADEAIRRDFDMDLSEAERRWFYMPFMHTEDLATQERCVMLVETRLNNPQLTHYAHHHRDIIVNFGRFPHRNAVLGRSATAAELRYLEEGGFSGVG